MNSFHKIFCFLLLVRTDAASLLLCEEGELQLKLWPCDITIQSPKGLGKTLQKRVRSENLIIQMNKTKQKIGMKIVTNITMGQ